MSYTQAVSTETYTPVHTRVGMCVTNEHPLVTIRRWQQRADDMRARAPATGITVFVLTHYCHLSEAEQRELTSAGVDLTAVDVQATL